MFQIRKTLWIFIFLSSKKCEYEYLKYLVIYLYMQNEQSFQEEQYTNVLQICE